MLNSAFTLSIGHDDVAEAKINQSQVQYQVNDESICSINNYQLLDFPCGAGAKVLCSQCRGPGFDPWSGNYDPTSLRATKRAPQLESPGTTREDPQDTEKSS